MRTLSLTEARRLVVASQLLAGPRPRSILEVVQRLGRIRVDPTWPAVHTAIQELAAWLGARSVSLPELPEAWRLPLSENAAQR